MPHDDQTARRWRASLRKRGLGRRFTSCSSLWAGSNWRFRHGSRCANPRASAEPLECSFSTRTSSRNSCWTVRIQRFYTGSTTGWRDLYVTAVTEAEVLTGIALSPEGKRRQGLATAADRAFRGMFADRVLPFDSSAAREYARIAAVRRAAGRPISQADCQIAAIAASRGGQVVTRNVRDFEGIEVAVINPWENA